MQPVLEETKSMSDFNSGVVLFDTHRRQYYTLDALATAVWELTGEPMTFDEIRDAIVERFGIDAGVAERDLHNLLQEMDRPHRGGELAPDSFLLRHRLSHSAYKLDLSA